MGTINCRGNFKVWFLTILILGSNGAFALNLNIAVPNNIKTLNPFKITIAQERFILPLVYESLFFKDVNGDLVPSLVQNWKVDEAKKLIYIKLKKEKIFSDGTPLLASHIADSIKLFCTNPRTMQKLTALRGCDKRNYKEGYKIIGDHEIILNSEYSANYLLETLARGNLLIVFEKNKKYLGTGNYVINLEKDIVNLTLTKRLGVNGFQKLIFKHVPEKEINKVLTKTSEIDVASMYFPVSDDIVEKGEFLQLRHAANVVMLLSLNSKKKPFLNEEVREAIQHEIIKSDFNLCKDYSRPIVGLLPKGVGGALLKKPKQKNVNIKDKGKFELHTLKDRLNKCEKTKLTNVFKKVGLEVIFKYYDSYEKFDPIVLERHAQSLVDLYVFEGRDSSLMVKNLDSKNKMNFFLNDFSWISEELEVAWRIPILKDRFYIYRKINERIFKESSLIGLYSIGHVNLIKKCLLSGKNELTNYSSNSFYFLNSLKVENSCEK